MNGESNERRGGLDGDIILGLTPLKFVKHHFLESELKTADDLVQEYIEYAGNLPDGNSPLQLSQECMDSATRQKLIWLLERLQEEVL